MKVRSVQANSFSNSIIRLAIVVGLLLLVPLSGMQFSHEVNWTTGDFIVAGVVLFSAGLIYELIVKKVRNRDSRLYITIALLLGLAWLWIELSVGLFTNWGS